MADEKKPLPWRGHNYGRVLSTVEIYLITRKKETIIGRIVKNDEDREAIGKKNQIHSF